jgi:hypothetical protein
MYVQKQKISVEMHVSNVNSRVEVFLCESQLIYLKKLLLN